MENNKNYTGEENFIEGVVRYSNVLTNVFACVNEEIFDNNLVDYSAWTDGACDNMNSNSPGGSAYIILKNGIVVEQRSKWFEHTTSNRMEMLAIISAICYFGDRPDIRLDIYTDSQYSMNVFTGLWAPKTNFDLVKLFYESAKKIRMVVFHKVKGHVGIEYNEKANDLAYNAYLDVVNLRGYRVGKYV